MTQLTEFKTRHAHVIALSMDRNYISQAKQMLAGLRHHAKWKEDFLILSHDVPELELAWFEKRGVFIQRVPFYFENKHLPAVTFSRFILFQNQIKCWKHVIFFDLDMLIRGDISALTNQTQMTAVRGFLPTIADNFLREKNPILYDELSGKFDLTAQAFNGGMLSFPTSIVNDDLFDKAIELTTKYLPISRFANQGLLNLLFYFNWKNISPIYNAYFPSYHEFGNLILENARVIHFNGQVMKPWDITSVTYANFYKEWERNLKLSDYINNFSENRLIQRAFEKLQLKIFN